MAFSVPIDTNDLDALPDNTALIENLVQKDGITTVLPRFIGTEDTGRFVTAFFIFQDKNVVLYARERDDNTSSLEKQTTVTLTKSPTVLGDLWNQTILIEDQDIDTIEHLKQRAEYYIAWLSQGRDPAISFSEYKHDPFQADLTGLPDCDHTETQDPVQAPNLNLTVTLCEDCNIPIIVVTDEGAFEAQDVIRSDYIGIPSDGNTVKGKSTTPSDPLTNAEVALHVLSRFASVEQSYLDIYSRNGDYGYLITIDNAIAGYALWTEFENHVALQQIYLLPQFRGSSIGEILVNAWYDQLDADHYYAISPNEAGLTTLEKTGHLEDGTATPATVLACRDTLERTAINANYVDHIRRGDGPLQQ